MKLYITRVVVSIAKNQSGYIVMQPARHISAIDFSATLGASGFAGASAAGASAAGAAFCAKDTPALANISAAIDRTESTFLFIYLFFVVYYKVK